MNFNLYLKTTNNMCQLNFTRLMIKKYFLCVLIFLFSAETIAEEKPVDPEFRESILPILIGAASITWGAYELGDDVESSQRNVQILWGSALVASAGLILYQESKDKGSQVVAVPNIQGGASIAYSYRF